MADEVKSLQQSSPIPPQIVNVGAPYGPLYLKDYIEFSIEDDPDAVNFKLADESPLPDGFICTTDGVVSGIAPDGTEGTYELIILADNGTGKPLKMIVTLTIRERILMEEGNQYFTSLKSQVWEALGKNLPLPEINDLFNRPLTVIEVYYLLQRFATLTIWDVYNLDPPGDKKLITLEGVSKRYNVYDRGSCLVGGPKDLFDHERTLFDALQTAKAMAREVFNRGWTIEFAGFDKMTRASWVEIQILSERYGKSIEVLHYHPTTADFRLFEKEIQAATLTPARGG